MKRSEQIHQPSTRQQIRTRRRQKNPSYNTCNFLVTNLDTSDRANKMYNHREVTPLSPRIEPDITDIRTVGLKNRSFMLIDVDRADGLGGGSLRWC